MADKTAYTNKAEGVDKLPPTPKKQQHLDSDIVEIEVVTAHDGLEVGYTKRVQRNSATTIYMIDNGYWQVN